MLGGMATDTCSETLDKPLLVRDSEGNGYIDSTEVFFSELFTQLT